jgi:hypothetical protein
MPMRRAVSGIESRSTNPSRSRWAELAIVTTHLLERNKKTSSLGVAGHL